MKPLISIRNMRKARGDRGENRIEIRRFTLAAGEIVGITGENGCGKSTLLDMMGLLLEPDSASDFHFFSGGDASAWSPAKKARFRREHFAYIPQRCGLLEFLNIRDNIDFTARMNGGRWSDFDNLVNMLELTSLLGKKPGKLSGGQRQKAAIVCALARRPKIIFADEPISALDPEMAGRVIQQFRGLARRQNVAVALVSHDERIVENLADKIYIFKVKRQANGHSLSTLDEPPAASPGPHQSKERR